MSEKIKNKKKIAKTTKKRKWLTLEKKFAIIILCHEDGATFAKIARKNKINKASLQIIFRKKRRNQTTRNEYHFYYIKNDYQKSIFYDKKCGTSFNNLDQRL